MESMSFFFCVSLLFCNQLREQNLAAALAAQGMGGIMAGISWGYKAFMKQALNIPSGKLT